MLATSVVPESKLSLGNESTGALISPDAQVVVVDDVAVCYLLARRIKVRAVFAVCSIDLHAVIVVNADLTISRCRVIEYRPSQIVAIKGSGQVYVAANTIGSIAIIQLYVP